MTTIAIALLKKFGPSLLLFGALFGAIWLFHHHAYTSGFDDAVAKAKIERQEAIDKALKDYGIKRDKQQALAIARVQQDKAIDLETQSLKQQVNNYVEKNNDQHDCVIDDDGLQLVNDLVRHANKRRSP